jgi:hypothetical protein
VLRGWPSDGAGIGFLRLDQLVDALVQLRVLGTIRYAFGTLRSGSILHTSKERWTSRIGAASLAVCFLPYPLRRARL